MIGIVIVSHGLLGHELVKTAEFIVGRLDACMTVSIGDNTGPEGIKNMIGEAIKAVDRKKGVILLTDMFGGTPTNISLAFLSAGRVEVLTGVNLPMLLKAVQIRGKSNLGEAAQLVGEYSRQSITVASELLG